MKILLSVICMMFLSMSSHALTKKEISASIDQMKETGMFTDQQLELARKKLEAMDEKDIKKLQESAIKNANDPEIQKKAKELLKKYKTTNGKQQ